MIDNETKALDSILSDTPQSKKYIPYTIGITLAIIVVAFGGTSLALKTSLLNDNLPSIEQAETACDKIVLTLKDPNAPDATYMPIRVFLDNETASGQMGSYNESSVIITPTNSNMFAGDTEMHDIIVWARDLDAAGTPGNWIGGQGTVKSIQWKKGFVIPWDRSACGAK